MAAGGKAQPGLQGYKDLSDQQLIEQVVQYYSHLINYNVDRLLIDLPPSVDREDLYAEGLQGLIEAIKRYDPERNVKFETYATFRIRGSIMDYLRSLDWAPRRLRRMAREIGAAQSELENLHGRAPAEEELAERLSLPVEEYRELLSELSALTVVSFRDLEDESGALTLPEQVEGESPTDDLTRRKFADALAHELAALPERDRTVLHLYYNEELSLKEIGEIMGLSESRICQSHTAAVLVLRRKLSTWRVELA
jgi:RNA polymerase sigma factor for flagellar operon FliA